MEETGVVKTYCPCCKIFEQRDGDYCSNCGGELTVPPPPRKCPKCDHEVRIADRYCKNCGTILKIDLPASPEPPALPKLPGGSTGLKRHVLYVTEVEVIGPE